MDWQEIAQIMGLSITKVKEIHDLAIRKIKRELILAALYKELHNEEVEDAEIQKDYVR